MVGPREALRTRMITLRDVNWLAGAPADIECAVKVRSHAPARAGARTPHWRNVRRRWNCLRQKKAVAPGQACVFYEQNGTRVLGGGWIARAEPARAAA